jgi:hypothetical protein
MSMTGDQLPVPLALRRERVVAILCQQVAADTLTLEEFEHRVERAHRALSLSELDILVSDLPAQATPAATPSTPSDRRQHPHQLAERRESQVMVAIMGGTTRKGPWVPARRTTVIAMMGGAELDFREAALAAGVTEITLIAVMGGAEIIVPPDLAIECDGVGIMGGFEHHAATTMNSGPAAPLLRIKGFALMGGVEVRVRLPGESAADARRRQREEQRAARKEQRRLQKENRSLKGW